MGKPSDTIDDFLPAEPSPRGRIYSNMLSSLLSYYWKKGLAGMEKICILQTLCAAASIPFVVDGESAEKELALDSLLELMSEEHAHSLMRGGLQRQAGRTAVVLSAGMRKQDAAGGNARMRFNPYASDFSETDFSELREHISNCIEADLRFQDPFAAHMSRYMPELSCAKGIAANYYSLIDACTRFNYFIRLFDEDVLFTSIADHYTINALCHADFCRSLGKACREDEKGLLLAAASDVDWEECWKSGVEAMETSFPNLAEHWIELQKTGGAVIVYDPLQKRDVCIASDE